MESVFVLGLLGAAIALVIAVGSWGNRAPLRGTPEQQEEEDWWWSIK